MVSIIHSGGWAISREATLDIERHMNDDRTAMTELTTVKAKNVFNALGELKNGLEVALLIKGIEYSGKVRKIGIETTTIDITGLTTGVKDKLKQLIK